MNYIHSLTQVVLHCLCGTYFSWLYLRFFQVVTDTVITDTVIADMAITYTAITAMVIAAIVVVERTFESGQSRW